MTARSIIRALEGRWCGSYGVCRCPVHDDHRPSLKVQDDPNKRDGIDLHCFSGCDWQAVKRELQRQDLLLGQGARGAHPKRRSPPTEPQAQSEDRSRFARDIWAKSKPAPGSIVEIYLKGRGITAAIPLTLRYHPGLKHGPTGLFLPAMVAGVSSVPDQKVVAIHRTFLRADGKGKARVSNAKMMLGPCGGGAVHLAPAGETLAIAEGIESGLSVQQATGIPTWACLSTSGLKGVVLPPEVRTVIIAADGDEPGFKAAEVSAARLTREGRKVKIAKPPIGRDFNDLLCLPENVTVLRPKEPANG